MRVFVQQPTVPPYRVPFFNALARKEQFEISVHGSPRVPGFAKSDFRQAEFDYETHAGTGMLGNRFYWQRNLTLPPRFGRGDVLVFNSNPRFLSNFGLVRQAKRKRCRVVAWNHWTSSTSTNLLAKWRQNWTLKNADVLLLYTDDEVKRLSTVHPDVKAVGLNNSLYPEPVLNACRQWGSNHNQDESPTNMLLRLRTEPSQKLLDFRKQQNIADVSFLTVGRLTTKMDLSLLLHALKNVREKLSAQLIVIGDGPEKQAMQNLAQQIGLSEHVKWISATYDESELAPYFLLADAFVYPGEIGLSIVHSFQYGLPVVTNDDHSNQMPEYFYLKDGVNGKTFRKGSSDHLAETMIELVGSHDRLHEYCLKTVYEDYSFDAMIRNFESAIELAANP